MAKNYKNRELESLINSVQQGPDVVEWTTSRGFSIKLQPIPPYLAQMALQSIEKPDPPTYEIVLASGEKEIHFHDETSIEQSSDDEKAKWTRYQEELSVVNDQMTELLLNIILLEGVIMNKEDEEKQAKRMRALRVRLPEDEIDRSIEIRKAYLIGCKEDADSITSMVFALSGISVKDLTLARDSFPDQVESE